MKPREVIERTTTPDGETLELAREGGYFVLRLGGIPLMSSAAFGSEEAMAHHAAQALGTRKAAQVLIGGLGMGFTLRAALESFPADAKITVAELLPSLIAYNQGVLGALAKHPLRDARVHLFEGDVRVPMQKQRWDAILLDIDNGPDAFTVASNSDLYSERGVASLAAALTDGGVSVIWSAYPSSRFERRLKQAGLECQTLQVRARGNVKKGSTHTLFVARARRHQSRRS